MSCPRSPQLRSEQPPRHSLVTIGTLPPHSLVLYLPSAWNVAPSRNPHGLLLTILQVVIQMPPFLIQSCLATLFDLQIPPHLNTHEPSLCHVLCFSQHLPLLNIYHMLFVLIRCLFPHPSLDCTLHEGQDDFFHC